jgi:DNA (cytosine-5)-methyltransferase 1
VIAPHELIVDSFAGGGGASLGIELALGRSPDIAINHDAEVIALHAANHPATKHYQENVWQVDPVEATGGRPVGLMWLSPDCKHFSKAKGGKPVSKKVRGLAWVACRWAKAVRPRVIVLENVEEFQTWGPVLSDGKPCPERKGHTFRRFVRRLERLGYVVQHRELRACDFGAPTIRRRLFIVARCDGQPIVWPAPSHGKGTPRPWRTAAECIDWSIPCPSIFTRSRPLAENTLRRVAAGLRKFVIESGRPFIVPIQNAGWGDRCTSLDTPLRTITATPKGGALALCAPTLIQTGYGERDGQAPRAPGLDKPLGTLVAGGTKHALVSAFLAKHYTGVDGSELFAPMGTVTAVDHHSLVTSHLAKLHGTSKDGQPVTEPLGTVLAQGTHFAEVRAFMVAYYGNEQDGASLFDPVRTVTAKDRLGLVTVEGQDYAIADIGLRMLAPRELYRAQGFPDSYQIDRTVDGKAITKTAQVRAVGNSVAPDVARAIVAAQFGVQLQAVAA